MNDPKTIRKKLLKQTFSSQVGIADSKKNVSSEKQGTCFGIKTNGEYIRRFKLYFRNGRIISIPYAHLPVLTFQPPSHLNIKTGDLEINLTGRALNILLEWLNEEKITWLKESPSGIDDGDGDIFISSMVASGELIV